MHFALALAVAINFWGARGVHTCQPTAATGQDAALQTTILGKYPYTEPMGVDVAGCRILLSSYGSALRHGYEVLYCADVAHEVGHLGGLGHTPDGLMAESIDESVAPYDCIHWRAFARRHGIPLRS